MSHGSLLQRLRRLWRHRWIDAGDVRRLLPPASLERLTARVAASEARHTGQVRLCVEAGLPWSYLRRDATPRERAVTLFGKLRVWDTERDNGVLVYLLLAERAIEIVADRGLAGRVDPATWQALSGRMAQAFRERHFEEGLALALDEATALLVAHYPRQPGEAVANELPDAPVLVI